MLTISTGLTTVMFNRLSPRPLLTTAIVALAVAFGAGDALAQTPAATIENSEGDVRLELNHNGSLLVPGDPLYDGTENDSIPATGAGTRMMWYPAKTAFRVGEVGFSSDKADAWDAESIGYHSVAFGRDTKASGDRSTAMGASTTASDLQATAMGSGTTASGYSATSMGSYTTAASSYSLSIGQCNDANTTSDGTLFAVGNGSLGSGGCSTPSNALVLDTDGNLTIAGGLTESSDRRLKTEIEPLGEDVLEALGEIRPVRFRFEEGTGHPTDRQLGLIAQEVQAHFPELVSEGSGGHLSLSYTKLSAVLLKGLQEQQEEVESKEQRIDELEERLSALEDKVQGDRPAAVGPGLGFLVAIALGGVAGAWLRSRREA